MLVNLATGLVEQGVSVDFITRSSQAPYIEHLATDVNRFFSYVVKDSLFLHEYLQTRKPDVVMAAKEKALDAVLHARHLSRKSFAVVARPGTNVSERLARQNILKRHFARSRLRQLYGQADLIVANSHGVAADISNILGIPCARIPVVHNPVITPALLAQPGTPCLHPWLREKYGVPTIVSMGRLCFVKGFDVLIEAVSRITGACPPRLVIFGQGNWRSRLKALADRLGVSHRVNLAGFNPSPHACLSRADLFVLSSRREGSPNALTEALALGVPAVATDCPSGPREILQDGRFGSLVPVDDAASLAQAITEALSRQPDRDGLKNSVASYSQAHCAAEYRRLFEVLRGQRS